MDAILESVATKLQRIVATCCDLICYVVELSELGFVGF